MKINKKAREVIVYFLNIINIKSLIQAVLIGLSGVSFNLFMLFAAAISLEKRYADIMTEFLFYPLYASAIFYLFCLISKKKFKSSRVLIFTILTLVLVTNLIDGYIYYATINQ
jgi:hypothetical protein